MKWIIASMPLWLGGFFFVAAGCFGLYRVARNPKNHPDDNNLLVGSAFCFLMAAVLLPMAAWVTP